MVLSGAMRMKALIAWSLPALRLRSAAKASSPQMEAQDQPRGAGAGELEEGPPSHRERRRPPASS